MHEASNRRSFIKQASLLLAASQARYAWAAEGESVIADTSSGKVRGTVSGDIKIFKGIPYGAPTSGKNRFMPPAKPVAWTGTRDALAFGPTAPQGTGRSRAGAPVESEDCLVLNVFTPALNNGKRRPVMVWLHGGGFATGSGSTPILDGTSLAHSGDAVIVTINHRLNVFGFTYLGEQAGADFSLSGGVGMLDIVAALQWVHDNISRFGGDPDLVTIFGQSGGGRKVATLMSMPSAQGLYHRAIIESGAVLRLTTKEDAIRASSLLLSELGLKAGDVRDLQNVSMEKLLAANAEVQKKLPPGEPGMVANSPTVDGKAIPTHPWDPKGPAMSARIPLLIGWAHTEETLYDKPTPELLALDEAGLRKRAAARLETDPAPVIDEFRKANPGATPWDLWILIATDHPRGAYSRELAKRKADQGAAPAYLYRFDWETPEGGGHMRSPHTIEIQFVFNNIKIAGPLISKMPEAYALAEKVSASWVAFARTGNPNVPALPKWPAYSAASRETMIFNNASRVENDPGRGSRLIMEKVLKLA
ncbi:MAG TPA: carboxylesterase/lipase family protein [Bryobacteraceae bacterium]|nr:carboxylesterase/lipase family protein [Bryobacteraceae bacterium]